MTTIEPLADGRVLVRGAHAEDPRVRALLAWLSRRAEVKRAEARASTASVVIEVAESDARVGSFVRRLRDELFVVASRRDARPIAMHLAHVLPGRARIRVEGASAEDLRRLAAWIGRRPGVTRVAPNDATGSILVGFDVERTTARAILDAALATKPSDWGAAPPLPRARRELSKTVYDTAVLGLAISGIAPPALTSVAVASTAAPPLRRALASLRERRVSVDVLDVAAIAISLATGQASTAAVLTWLLGIGDLLLAHASDRARDAMSKLAGMDVADAWLVRGERATRVRAKKLRRGDRVRVHTGERVPADGVVVSGAASVDEKALTGESKPRTARPGARVLAASVLRAGQIDVEVTHAGGETAAANILRVLQDAGAKPMTLQRDTARVADRVVLPTIALAIGAGALSGELARTTSVLITDFGSGLRVAIPTAALGAIGRAARHGVLVKGGQYLERLSKVDVIVFDKTGTLTHGTPRIVEVAAPGRLGEADALALAAAAESRQTHPDGTALRALARDRRAPDLDGEVGAVDVSVGAGVAAQVAGRRVLVGSRRLMEAQGVDLARAADVVADLRARGASTVFAAVDGEVELVLGYADVVREEARAVLDAIRDGGRREVVLMSGDTAATVDAVADALGITRRASRMLPQDKAREVRAMQREGRVVAMIGDGINDAPALAVADVGISLHGGTDVALETADVVLRNGGLASLPEAFALADAGMASVRRCLWLVVAPNAVAIALGALGSMGPGAATVINNGSTVVAALAGALGGSPPRAHRRGR